MSELSSAVEQAFRNAIRNKPYRSISVKDLCAEANVTRKAFYKRFDGKASVLQHVFDRDVVQPAIELCTLLSFERMSKFAPVMERHMFNAVYEDGSFYQDVVSAPQGGEAALQQIIEESFHDFNLFMLDEFNYSQEAWQGESIASYFAMAKAGYIVKWIKSGYEVSVDDVSELYSAMALPFWSNLGR